MSAHIFVLARLVEAHELLEESREYLLVRPPDFTIEEADALLGAIDDCYRNVAKVMSQIERSSNHIHEHTA